MLCQNCKKKQASIHFVKVINGKKTEMHLCDECAPQKEMSTFGGFGFGIGDILGGMFGTLPQSYNRLVCDVCKTDLDTFSKTGKLGCSKCYDVFAEHLKAPLARIHGSAQYLGKVPKGKAEEVKKPDKLEELKSKLADAIKNEDFEQAATLRDEIRAIEGGTKK